MWSHLLNVHIQCTICLATTCSQWLAFSFMTSSSRKWLTKGSEMRRNSGRQCVGSPISSQLGRSFCNARPRCHHVIRTLPPRQSIENARRHDEGMEQTMGVEISETHGPWSILGFLGGRLGDASREGLPSGRKCYCAIAPRGPRHGVCRRIEGGSSDLRPSRVSGDPSGMICAGECDLLPIIRMSQASGHMNGNTTRPLLPNSSDVRP